MYLNDHSCSCRDSNPLGDDSDSEAEEDRTSMPTHLHRHSAVFSKPSKHCMYTVPDLSIVDQATHILAKP